MRLNDKPIQAVVYIIATLPNIDGSTYTNTGTGFVYENEFGRFIVTNNHVVNGSTHILIYHNSGQLKLPSGSYKIFRCASPSIDLILLSTENNMPNIPSFTPEDIPSNKELMELDYAEPVIMIGYPGGYTADDNFMPICRTGNTATHVTLPFKGRKEFLIDCHTTIGSSGSPVVLSNGKLVGIFRGGLQVLAEDNLPHLAVALQSSHLLSDISYAMTRCNQQPTTSTVFR